MDHLIYCVKNSINDKVYIGVTRRGLKIRFREHCALAEGRACGKNNRPSLIQKAIAKYGVENFSIELLATAPTPEKARELEIKFIAEYGSDKRSGYNMTDGGEAVVMTPEVRDKIRQATLRSWRTSENRRLGVLKRVEKQTTPEGRRALSMAVTKLDFSGTLYTISLSQRPHDPSSVLSTARFLGHRKMFTIDQLVEWLDKSSVKTSPNRDRVSQIRGLVVRMVRSGKLKRIL